MWTGWHALSGRRSKRAVYALPVIRPSGIFSLQEGREKADTNAFSRFF